MFNDRTTFSSPLTRGAVLALVFGVASVLLSPEVRAQGMNMPGMGEQKAAPQGAVKTATGAGTVEALNVASQKITVQHGPMPELDWPAMKMEFSVAAGVDLTKVKTGDKVRFTVTGSGSSYTVQSISPAP